MSDTVTFEQACSMLPDGDSVHTFRNPRPMMIIGANWERHKIIEALQNAPEICLSGDVATNMHHGIAINTGGSWLFIETKSEARDA